MHYISNHPRKTFLYPASQTSLIFAAPASISSTGPPPSIRWSTHTQSRAKAGPRRQALQHHPLSSTAPAAHSRPLRPCRGRALPLDRPSTSSTPINESLPRSPPLSKAIADLLSIRSAALHHDLRPFSALLDVTPDLSSPTLNHRLPLLPTSPYLAGRCREIPHSHHRLRLRDPSLARKQGCRNKAHASIVEPYCHTPEPHIRTRDATD